MNKGDKKNSLTMISDPYPGKSYGNPRAMFRCDCGKTKEIFVRSVATGRTRSCGCLQLAYARKRSYKHGMTYTRLYGIWCNMKDRCSNPNNIGFNLYGGRGITVCDEWCIDFRCFEQWAVTNGYNDDLTIDRVNVNKGYSPNNCRWVTPKEQSRNRRSNIMITLNGETHCLIEWCEILNLPYQTIEMRIHRGWDKEKAITTPIKKEGS